VYYQSTARISKNVLTTDSPGFPVKLLQSSQQNAKKNPLCVGSGHRKLGKTQNYPSVLIFSQTCKKLWTLEAVLERLSWGRFHLAEFAIALSDDCLKFCLSYLFRSTCSVEVLSILLVMYLYRCKILYIYICTIDFGWPYLDILLLEM